MTTETRPAVCDYCKLPLLSGWWDKGRPRSRDEQAEQGREEPLYCCLGCQIAAAILEEKSDARGAHSTLVRLGLSIFCTMNVMAFTMALWTDDVYGRVEAPGALAVTMNGLLRHLVLLFSLPVLFFLGFPLFRHAWTGLKRGVLSTDWLLASGVAASYLFSFLSVVRGTGPIYFEVGCVILVMTTLGRWLEANGKLKANAALDALTKLLPEKVRRVAVGGGGNSPSAGQPFQADVRLESLTYDMRDGDRIGVGQPFQADVPGATGASPTYATQDGDRIGVGQPFQADVPRATGASLSYDSPDGERIGVGQPFQSDVRLQRLTYDEQWVALADVKVDDLLRVLPGERFPVDGEVVRNRGLVEEQVLTGESRPVLKEPGDRVLGGTLNLDGDLTLRVSAVGEHGTLARLVAMVRDARESKGRYQRLADRAACRFVPLVFTIACCAVGAHWAFGSLSQGFWAGLAVTLIACPCALGLAAPLAIWSALGNAASQRVLFRSGEALERLAEIVAVRFDKTGTLTSGAARLSHWIVECDHDREAILARAASLACTSSHAISRAIVEAASGRDPRAPERVNEIRIVPGLGVQGVVEDTNSAIFLGSPRFMREQKLALGAELEDAVEAAELCGLPLCMVGWDDTVRGLFAFEEDWRPKAHAVTRWLTALPLDVGVLTGDHKVRGHAIAEELGVCVEAELLPDQKVAAIGRIQRAVGPVCMIGDGINDAPALAASDVGIALGCGTDVSRDSASVCLLGDDLSHIPWSIELARRTRQIVRWNLIWAFGYNTVGIGFAAVGWLNPALAALLMVASSALVTVNSLRLSQPFTISLDEADAEGGRRAGTPAPLECLLTLSGAGLRARHAGHGRGVVDV
jgi:heavy metal translocating P-type ATPase